MIISTHLIMEQKQCVLVGLLLPPGGWLLPAGKCGEDRNREPVLGGCEEDRKSIPGVSFSVDSSVN